MASEEKLNTSDEVESKKTVEGMNGIKSKIGDLDLLEASTSRKRKKETKDTKRPPNNVSVTDKFAEGEDEEGKKIASTVKLEASDKVQTKSTIEVSLIDKFAEGEEGKEISPTVKLEASDKVQSKSTIEDKQLVTGKRLKTQCTSDGIMTRSKGKIGALDLLEASTSRKRMKKDTKSSPKYESIPQSDDLHTFDKNEIKERLPVKQYTTPKIGLLKRKRPRIKPFAPNRGPPKLVASNEADCNIRFPKRGKISSNFSFVYPMRSHESKGMESVDADSFSVSSIESDVELYDYQSILSDDSNESDLDSLTREYIPDNNKPMLTPKEKLLKARQGIKNLIRNIDLSDVECLSSLSNNESESSDESVIDEWESVTEADKVEKKIPQKCMNMELSSTSSENICLPISTDSSEYESDVDHCNKVTKQKKNNGPGNGDKLKSVVENHKKVPKPQHASIGCPSTSSELICSPFSTQLLEKEKELEYQLSLIDSNLKKNENIIKKKAEELKAIFSIDSDIKIKRRIFKKKIKELKTRRALVDLFAEYLVDPEPTMYRSEEPKQETKACGCSLDEELCHHEKIIQLAKQKYAEGPPKLSCLNAVEKLRQEYKGKSFNKGSGKLIKTVKESEAGIERAEKNQPNYSISMPSCSKADPEIQ